MLDSKRRGRIAVGAAGILFGFAYCIAALSLPLGKPSSPGPGAFPLIVGAGSVLVSVVVIAQAALTRDVSGDIGFPRGAELRKSIHFFGATTGMVVLLPVLGQYVVASAYTTFLVWSLGRTSLLRAILYGVLSGLVISWAFVEVLDVPLPTGVFGR